MATYKKMLTPEEREFLANVLRKYPKGVPSDAWGWGPLTDADVHHLYEVDRETRKQYGSPAVQLVEWRAERFVSAEVDYHYVVSDIADDIGLSFDAFCRRVEEDPESLISLLEK